MNTDDARRFVRKMQDDLRFRCSVTRIGTASDLRDFLKQRGFDFNPCDLVRAMAACIAESENTTENSGD